MTKASFICAAAAIAAALCLPAAATAAEWQIKPEGGGTYPLSLKGKGGVTKMTTAGGTTIECTSMTGTGQYSNATKGFLALTLTGCTDLMTATSCTTKGEAAGTITVAAMALQNIYLEPKKTRPGVLTQSNLGTFATFACNKGMIGIDITGSVLAEMTSPKCGATKQATATWVWAAAAAGTQQWITIEKEPALGQWDMKMSINGGGANTVSMDATYTITFGEVAGVSCP